MAMHSDDKVYKIITNKAEKLTMHNTRKNKLTSEYLVYA